MTRTRHPWPGDLARVHCTKNVALALAVWPESWQVTKWVPVPFVVVAVLVYVQDTAPPASATFVAVMP